MNLNINIASFNIGSTRDWKSLASREVLLKEVENESYAKMEPATAQNLEYKKLFLDKLEEIDEKIGDKYIETQKLKTFDALHTIIDRFNPAVFCLQEYFPFTNPKETLPQYNYKFIQQILADRGYTLIEHEKDLAIAYHSDEYDLITPKMMTLPLDQYHTYQLPLVGKEVFTVAAMYIDVKHKKTGAIVRLVTDHVSGFDGKSRKEETQTRKQENDYKKLTLANSHAKRLQQFAEILLKSHKPDRHPFKGDYTLEKSLQAVTSQAIPVRNFKDLGALDTIRIKLLSLLNRIFKGHWGIQPDFVIYGLDANTTTKTASHNPENRLHPKRMRLFDKHDFTYANNASPTIIDANDFQKRKYDYVAAKALSSTDQIAVEDKIFNDINHSSLLDQPQKIMSDHLPVLSTVTYTRNPNPTLFSRLRPNFSA